jgi:hypothetical protein
VTTRARRRGAWRMIRSRSSWIPPRDGGKSGVSTSTGRLSCDSRPTSANDLSQCPLHPANTVPPQEALARLEEPATPAGSWAGAATSRRSARSRGPASPARKTLASALSGRPPRSLTTVGSPRTAASSATSGAFSSYSLAMMRTLRLLRKLSFASSSTSRPSQFAGCWTPRGGWAPRPGRFPRCETAAGGRGAKRLEQRRHAVVRYERTQVPEGGALRAGCPQSRRTGLPAVANRARSFGADHAGPHVNVPEVVGGGDETIEAPPEKPRWDEPLKTTAQAAAAAEPAVHDHRDARAEHVASWTVWACGSSHADTAVKTAADSLCG